MRFQSALDINNVLFYFSPGMFSNMWKHQASIRQFCVAVRGESDSGHQRSENARKNMGLLRKWLEIIVSKEKNPPELPYGAENRSTLHCAMWRIRWRQRRHLRKCSEDSKDKSSKHNHTDHPKTSPTKTMKQWVRALSLFLRTGILSRCWLSGFALASACVASYNQYDMWI